MPVITLAGINTGLNVANSALSGRKQRSAEKRAREEAERQRLGQVNRNVHQGFAQHLARIQGISPTYHQRYVRGNEDAKFDQYKSALPVHAKDLDRINYDPSHV